MRWIRSSTFSAGSLLFAVTAVAAPTTPNAPIAGPIPTPTPGAGIPESVAPAGCDRDAIASAAARLTRALKADLRRAPALRSRPRLPRRVVQAPLHMPPRLHAPERERVHPDGRGRRPT